MEIEEKDKKITIPISIRLSQQAIDALKQETKNPKGYRLTVSSVAKTAVMEYLKSQGYKLEE